MTKKVIKKIDPELKKLLENAIKRKTITTHATDNYFITKEGDLIKIPQPRTETSPSIDSTGDDDNYTHYIQSVSSEFGDWKKKYGTHTQERKSKKSKTKSKRCRCK